MSNPKRLTSWQLVATELSDSFMLFMFFMVKPRERLGTAGARREQEVRLGNRRYICATDCAGCETAFAGPVRRTVLECGGLTPLWIDGR